MNHSRLLHIYDFAATPYDGDARQAHQLIPFILAKLGTAKLSYILNIKDFPDPKPDSLLVLLEAEHSKAMDAVARLYQSRRENYDLRLFPLYMHEVARIQTDPTLSPDAQEQAIAELQLPALPTIPALPVTPFSTAMVTQLDKSREQARRFEQAADEALQLIRSFLSVRCLTVCADVIHDTTHTSRQKVLAVWEWLKSKRAFDPQIISEIKKDMNLLPIINNYDEAVSALGHLNQLQAELRTLKAPLSDLELIITHSNKLAAHEQFVQLRLKYLQTTALKAGELAPSFNTPMLSTPTTQASLSWADYSLDVVSNARAYNHVSRTTSVLAATSHSDSASTSSPYDRRRPFERGSDRGSDRYDPRDRSQDRDRQRFRDRKPDRSQDQFRERSRDRFSSDKQRDSTNRRRDRSRDQSRSSDRQPDRSPGNQMDPATFQRYKEEKAKAYADVRARFNLPPQTRLPGRVNSTTHQLATTSPAKSPSIAPTQLPESEYRALRAATSRSPPPPPPPSTCDHSNDSDEYDDYSD